MMNTQLILEKQDLTYMTWSKTRNSSGAAGSFLKAHSELGGDRIYYKLSNFDKNNIVHLSGMLSGGTTTPQTALVNLPVGYRPRKREIFPAVAADTSCVIEVVYNGDVLIRNQVGSWVSLSGISFRV